MVSTCVVLANSGISMADETETWPQWRGPSADGVSADGRPPLEWSESNNVQWKVKIPGNGSSTPIIWGNQVFITTAVSTAKAGDKASTPQAVEIEAPAPATPVDGERRRRRPGGGGGMRGEAPDHPYEFVLMCLDRKTGGVIWQKVVTQEKPHEGHHHDHGFASHSPITDGERVYAYFGSRGLHCFDMDGALLWSKQLGQMQTRNSFGEGSSPALVGKVLVINWDHEGADFVVALDKVTGKERWRKERDEPTSWSTPLAVQHEGKWQAVVSATNKIRSYDVETGDVIWECGGMTLNVIPTPVVKDGVLYAASGFRGNALLAIKLGGKGDLTGTDSVLWSHDARTPYVPSPVLYEDRLYFFSGNTGMLSSLDVKTGAVKIDAERVPGLTGVYASPVAAAGRLYLTGRGGEVVVIKPDDTLEVLASNKLDDRFDASPAAVGNQLFLRGHQYLYCLSE
ncbi:hypothetical protein FEM03_13445 [Phragmitibacter flavus]|uniref:Pyrrolo-quinoline quinone repeat domain-containing protein n=2 Tax=Phragmitibacter flavus TaxID=2576071 RepID=A0A5R8KDH3_9BACT|nr:hypothetical protein FEM03_13445 [Phragmitibacter flavus]